MHQRQVLYLFETMKQVLRLDAFLNLCEMVMVPYFGVIFFEVVYCLIFSSEEVPWTTFCVIFITKLGCNMVLKLFWAQVLICWTKVIKVFLDMAQKFGVIEFAIMCLISFKGNAGIEILVLLEIYFRLLLELVQSYVQVGVQIIDPHFHCITEIIHFDIFKFLRSNNLVG